MFMLIISFNISYASLDDTCVRLFVVDGDEVTDPPLEEGDQNYEGSNGDLPKIITCQEFKDERGEIWWNAALAADGVVDDVDACEHLCSMGEISLFGSYSWQHWSNGMGHEEVCSFNVDCPGSEAIYEAGTCPDPCCPNGCDDSYSATCLANDGWTGGYCSNDPVEESCNECTTSDESDELDVDEDNDGVNSFNYLGEYEGYPICSGPDPPLGWCWDNCPTVYNPDQMDIDGDSIGDVCDDETCYDQLDNNDNGETDCAENSCDGEQCGSYPGSMCIDGECKELICDDGLDNDEYFNFFCGDGVCYDAEDPWCETDCSGEVEGAEAEGCELPPPEGYIAESSCENAGFLWGIGAVYDKVCTDKPGVGESCNDNEDCFWQPIPFISPGDSCIDGKCIAHSDIYILLGASPSLCVYDYECSSSELCKPVAVGYLAEQCLCEDNKEWNSETCQCEDTSSETLSEGMENYLDQDEYDNLREILIELDIDIEDRIIEEDITIIEILEEEGITVQEREYLEDINIEEIILSGSPGPFLPPIETYPSTEITKPNLDEEIILSSQSEYVDELLEEQGDLKNTELIATFIRSDDIITNNRVQSQFYQSMLSIGLSEEMAQEYSNYYSQLNTQNIYAGAIRTNLVGFASEIEESDGIDCLDSDCDLQPCNDGSICVNYECVEASYNPPAPIVFEIEPAYQIQTYYDFLMYLNEGEYLSGEEITNDYNGVCDDYCESIGGICGFANSGLNECSSEGSNTCVCYNEHE